MLQAFYLAGKKSDHLQTYFNNDILKEKKTKIK